LGKTKLIYGGFIYVWSKYYQSMVKYYTGNVKNYVEKSAGRELLLLNSVFLKIKIISKEYQRWTGKNVSGLRTYNGKNTIRKTPNKHFYVV